MASREPPSDDELVGQIARGDRDAFAPASRTRTARARLARAWTVGPSFGCDQVDMSHHDLDSEIIDRLRRLDRVTVVPPPDPHAEAALLAAFDAAREHPEGRAKALRHRSRRAAFGGTGLQPGHLAARGLAIAAVIALAAGAAVWMRANRVPAGAPAPVAVAVAEPMDFVPWPGASALPPFESGQLVRMDLPASMLPSLGLFPPASDVAFVSADVLIGQDGLARAVRLLPATGNDPSTRVN